jgi:hypothetical protein
MNRSLPAAMFAAILPNLSAQTLLLRIDGNARGDTLGRSVASAGDLDGDGFDDFVIGADLVDATGRDSGEVYVYSGKSIATGTPARLFTLTGAKIGDFLGISVASAGDVDADGFDDLIVGAYGDDPANTLNAGSAFVYSGRNGARMYTFHGSTRMGEGIEDHFGYAVAGAGDVDGDGFDDVVVGAYSADVDGMVDAGYAKVFSGRDGSVLFTITGSSAKQYVGLGLAGAGDVDGDGRDDLLVGVVGDASVGTFGGAAVVVSWAPEVDPGYVVLRRYGANAAGEIHGASVARVTDVDGDRIDEHVVGAVFADANGAIGVGTATVYSGATGAVLHVFAGSARNSLFGFSVAGLNDVDGDGRGDVLVGGVLESRVSPNAGAAVLTSGADGTILATFGSGAAADGFGYSVASAGDVDGDGLDELIVGAPFADNNGAESGSAYVFDDMGVNLRLATIREFGAGCPHASGGQPSVFRVGRPSFGTRLDLGVRGTLPGNQVVMNLGRPFNTPLQLGAYGFGTACAAYAQADGFVVGRVANSAGIAVERAILVPNDPTFVGAPVIAQWLCQDPNAPGGWVFSDALRLVIGH